MENTIIDFNTVGGTEKFYLNQRLYTKKQYLEDVIENHGIENISKYEKAIDLYFQSLDNYPEYLENNCIKNYIPNLDLNPDHTYASRISGIYSDFILRMFEQYYIKTCIYKRENK